MRACLSLLILLLPSLAAATSIDAMIFTRQGEVSLSLELATTPETRAQGLMKRHDMGGGDGMLFLFPTAKRHSFWMKDTPRPLDMLFVDADHSIAHIVPDTVPYSTTAHRPPKPVLSVIELDAGSAARKGISVGDKVKYALPSSIEVR